MMPRPLYLGLDGGGSGCRVVIAYQTGSPLGFAEGGSANPYVLGTEQAWANLNEAIAAALAAAGLSVADKARIHACFGLAGVDRAPDREAFLASGHPFANLQLVTDPHIALVGALGKEEGALLIAGTGSILYALDASGARYRVGGWGLSIGDEGSGAWLGREAVRAAFFAHDRRGEASSLSDSVLSLWGPDIDNVLRRVQTATSRDFGQFAPCVLAAAAAGDKVAQAIKGEAVQHLISLLAALEHRYPPGPLAFSTAGSIARLLIEEVLEDAPLRFREGYQPPKAPPHLGALEMARASF